MSFEKKTFSFYHKCIHSAILVVTKYKNQDVLLLIKEIFSLHFPLFRYMKSRMLSYLKTVNIYIKKDGDTIEIQQNQLFATRLFIVLFLISLISLVGYASLTLRLINVQIKNPLTFHIIKYVYLNIYFVSLK